VRLGLHVREDARVGWDVAMVIRARPASLEWPEMACWAAMSEPQRAAWLAEHERRCAPTRRARRTRSPALTAVTPVGAPTEPPARADLSVSGIRELRSADEFRAAVAGGPVVITDNAYGARLHPRPAVYLGVTEENFRRKVIAGHNRNGRYYSAPDKLAAQSQWPSLNVCGTCD